MLVDLTLVVMNTCTNPALTKHRIARASLWMSALQPTEICKRNIEIRAIWEPISKNGYTGGYEVSPLPASRFDITNRGCPMRCHRVHLSANGIALDLGLFFRQCPAWINPSRQKRRRKAHEARHEEDPNPSPVKHQIRYDNGRKCSTEIAECVHHTRY